MSVIHALRFSYDRYNLVLFPSLIYIALRVTETGFSKAIAAGGVALLGVAALAGTWDNLRFSQATWDAYHELSDAGVAAADFNAGYAINGWMRYAHPENLHPGEDPRRDVPWVTSAGERPYAIARSALAGFDVVKEISWGTVPGRPRARSSSFGSQELRLYGSTQLRFPRMRPGALMRMARVSVSALETR